MEKYLTRLNPNSHTKKPIKRNQWKRYAIEISGKFDAAYRHDLSPLLIDSYSEPEIGKFEHLYHVDGMPCQTHNHIRGNHQPGFQRQGVASIDFDSKGIYIVSTTYAGCLTVHDFESLYCQSINSSSCLMDDESKHLLHLSVGQRLDRARWNLANQDEVVCTSMRSNEVLIFDIGYISSKPIEVLRTRTSATVHGFNIQKGLADIAFDSMENSRLIAADTYGSINIWDRRSSALPCLQLTSKSRCALNSVEVNTENQVIFAADKLGFIHMWDLRGGRTSAAFQSSKEDSSLPFTSLKLASMLEKIAPLKAQTTIVPKEIHSIDLNPSCRYQLAFHLDDGWSGIFDIYNTQVTHIHCPPPPEWSSLSVHGEYMGLRQPSWLSTYSIYAVGSPTDESIHLIDFYPNPTSPSHVDYSEDKPGSSELKLSNKKNKSIRVSGKVLSCAAHPINGTIIAGTKTSSLLLVSQQHQSC